MEGSWQHPTKNLLGAALGRCQFVFLFGPWLTRNSGAVNSPHFQGHHEDSTSYTCCENNSNKDFQPSFSQGSVPWAQMKFRRLLKTILHWRAGLYQYSYWTIFIDPWSASLTISIHNIYKSKTRVWSLLIMNDTCLLVEMCTKSKAVLQLKRVPG